MTKNATRGGNDPLSQITAAIESTLAETDTGNSGGAIPDQEIDDRPTTEYTRPMVALANGDDRVTGGFVGTQTPREDEEEAA